MSAPDIALLDHVSPTIKTMTYPLEIVPLSTDIYCLVKSYLDQCAEAYHLEYARSPPSDELDMTRLCMDHKDPILSGIDDLPVLTITVDQWVGIFGYDYYHFFPGWDSLFRLAVFCKLDVPQTISLLLKANWEKMVAPNGYPNGHTKLHGYLNRYHRKKVIRRFRPKTKTISKMVRKLPYQTNYYKSRFLVEDLMMKLLKTGLFLNASSKVAEIFTPEKSEHFNKAAIKKYKFDLSCLN